jgi:hypothetical protein
LKIYISGPISGMEDGNRRAFEMASMQLDICGYESVSPHRNGLPIDAEWTDHMRADIRMLLHCDALAMLPGWERSKGAKIEHGLALSLGMEVRALDGWLP